ncbi:NADH-quinone oxidoreductase subunit K [Thermofilum sp.]|jgi:NADH-quinone oxidoreductase subunit K/NAD(P)H-quinone oxidoreductase subunit 4L|uniref:NADH-quinone oxidoreductase subunit K n=1 Tax=Thermofilum sp. TaxID=1961369 RepID=UPI002587A0B5|nr:NADH-quinone oxidoreductase subunit K [Thermofilum sp.]
MNEQLILIGLGGVLAVSGLCIVAATRNLIKIAMGMQAIILGSLMITAVALNSLPEPNVDPILLVTSVCAASETVSLSILYMAREKHRTIDPQKISKLKG